MKEIIQFAGHTLEIWRRPRQRHMHLTVRPDGSLRVTCNRGLSKLKIMAFVSDNQAFIARRALEIETLKKRYPPKAALSGETWLLGGRQVPLQVIWTWSGRPQVRGGETLELKVQVSTTREERLAAMCRHYRRLAKAHFESRVSVLSERMGLVPSRLVVRGQNTRWGSCTSAGVISLNWKLMAAPGAVIDYVIVHELAHVQHMDHSAAFWRLVERFHPDVRFAKSWLREHEHEIAALFRE